MSTPQEHLPNLDALFEPPPQAIKVPKPRRVKQQSVAATPPADDLPDLSHLFEPPAPVNAAPKSPRAHSTGAREVFQPQGSAWSIDHADGVKQFYRGTFGRHLPVSAFGQSGTHDKMGLDHSHSMDVPLHPDSKEGRALTDYLRTNSIPFLAYDRAVPGGATGAHIHVGNPSHGLGAGGDESSYLSDLPNLDALFEPQDTQAEDDEVVRVDSIPVSRAVAPAVPPSLSPRAPLNPYSLEDREQRDLAAAARVRAVTLPLSRSLADYKDAPELMADAYRHGARALNIPSDYVEEWIKSHPNDLQLINSATGELHTPADLLGSSVHDERRGTVRLNLGGLSDLERDYQAQRSLLSRVTDAATDDTTTAGEKASSAVGVALRPLGTLSTGAAGLQRSVSTSIGALAGDEESQKVLDSDIYSPVNIIKATWERFKTGEVPEGYENPIAQGLDLLHQQKNKMPLPAWRRMALEIIGDPMNYASLNLVGEGARALKGTRIGQRLLPRGLTVLDIERAADDGSRYLIKVGDSRGVKQTIEISPSVNPSALSGTAQDARIVSGEVLRPQNAGGRDVVTVEKSDGMRQAFYRSSGQNSGQPGEWFPFGGIVERGAYDGWFNKTPFVLNELSDTAHPLHRYGTEENKQIGAWLKSQDIPEGVEVPRAELNARLKEFGAFDETTERYGGFVPPPAPDAPALASGADPFAGITPKQVTPQPPARPDLSNLADAAVDEWRQFSPDTGSLNVPRSSMPQVKSEHRGALVQFLKGRGITHTQIEIAPNTLKPSQAEFSPAKVENARGFEGPQRPILLSSDGHVLDGHHQWLSSLADAPDTPISAIQLDAPINQLLIETARFPSSGVDAAGKAAAVASQPDFNVMVDGELARVLSDDPSGLRVEFKSGGTMDISRDEINRGVVNVRPAQPSTRGGASSITGGNNQRAIPVKAAATNVVAASADETAKPATYGAQNALVTADRAAAARARLRQKLSPNRLNAGLDPSVLANMAEIAAFHVEAGARDFAAFSARMLEDVGDEVQPYLRDLFDHSFTRLDLTPPSGSAATAVAESVATQARTPLPEIISSVRKAGLLTGFKTHARNVLGTGAFQVAEEASRVSAAVADIIVSMATGRRTVGGADMGSFLYATRQAATKGVREARQIMKHGIDAEGMRQLQVTQELNSGSRILDAYTNTTFRLLNAEDKIFRTFAVSRSLEEQAAVIARNEARAGKIARSEIKARALDLRTNPTPQMETQAISDAEFATFNNDNFVTSNITGPVRQKLRESTKGRWANAAIDLVLPFDRTPTNIIARILEYSGGLPVSVGKLGYQAAAKKITGRVFTEADQKAFAQTFGRGSVGATLLTLGYVLHANGLMTGMYDDEQDERGRNNVQRAAGQPPMSVRIGNTWHQVGAFSPLGNLLAIGATLHRERTQPLKHEEERAGRMLDIGKDVIMQQPLLQAAREVTDDGRAGERLGRVAGSFVPTIVADAADAHDDKQREARGLSAQVQKRVPFAREGLPEAEDVFGRPLEHRRTAAVDPTGSTTARDGQVERELQRLQVSIGKLKRTDAETEEERRARLHTDGAELYQTLNELIASRDYQGMMDADRRAALSKEVRTTRARQTREHKE